MGSAESISIAGLVEITGVVMSCPWAWCAFGITSVLVAGGVAVYKIYKNSKDKRKDEDMSLGRRKGRIKGNY